MILKWLSLSIVLDVLSCTEKMFKLPRKVVSIKKPKEGRAIVVLLKSSCLGSFKLFLFIVVLSSYFAFSSFFNFLIFLRCSGFSWGCSGFFGGVPGFSGVPVFRCSWKYYMPRIPDLKIEA